MDIARQYDQRLATIPNGGTASGAVDIRGYSGGGFQMPAELTGANVTLQVRNVPGGQWKNCVNIDGNETPTARPAFVFGADNVHVLWLEVAFFAEMRFLSDQAETADRLFHVYLTG